MADGGYLLIDHSHGQDPTGRAGQKLEYRTESCYHCQSVIAILARPTEQVTLSNLDVFAATERQAELPVEYRHKYRCQKCKQNICRVCAAKGFCSPFEFKVELAAKYGVVLDIPYPYAQCLGS